ncbi:Cyclin-O protein A [Dissostichus eleginoides]|uniref:G2/mitotic-specific cyclin-B2 n=1 Tax=Dissostichus eleginoides TaxID=100907 RepID=A0AAD9C1E0_DISEL|nr:Cyclin-O protein A [Dissostichus eleginoides]
MVSFVNGSKTVSKRRRTICASPSKEALTAVHQRQPARHRKQTLMSKLSDSGFDEDLGSSPISSPARIDVSPLRSDEPTSGRLSNWYLQYGDIGFKIQMDKEARFYSCKSLARQPQLTTEARCKLVSWLIPVHKHLHLSFECCCLAVNIMDRFMVTTPVAADCFQLLGVTALLLASKQVEVFSPRISHLLSMCCDAFTKEQLCNLECLILLRLNFRLSAPTLAFFLDYYTNCIEDAQLESEKTGGGRFERTKRSGQCSSLAQKNKGLLSMQPSSYRTSGAVLLMNYVPNHLKALIYLRQTLAVKGHFLYVSQGKHTLAQECKENLLLLVSLNQETMEMMSAM